MYSCISLFLKWCRVPQAAHIDCCLGEHSIFFCSFTAHSLVLAFVGVQLS